MTFAAGSYTNRPVCNVWRQGGGVVSWAVSNTAISIATSTAMTAGEDIGYRCDSKA